jgi:hypothetical protein
MAEYEAEYDSHHGENERFVFDRKGQTKEPE